ncbi:MAG: dTDP-4-dehydrorhamnose reductase [bacterium]
MVTGARGMLGSDLCDVLSREFEVYGVDIDDFDIADEGATFNTIIGIHPDTIVHLAAYTDVEGSETNPDKAFLVNGAGTLNVARAAREIDAYLIYLSTDYVFDGTKSQPYVEIDPINPISIYGLSKAYGEMYASRVTRRNLIVRTSWLFGPNGINFVDKVIKQAESGKPLKVVNDQHGCPTYTMHLAFSLREVIKRKIEGILHIVGTGETTWFDFARTALDLAGIEVEIQPVPTEAYPAKARRPRHSVLSSVMLSSFGLKELPIWKEGLKEHLRRGGRLKG